MPVGVEGVRWQLVARALGSKKSRAVEPPHGHVQFQAVDQPFIGVICVSVLSVAGDEKVDGILVTDASNSRVVGEEDARIPWALMLT